MVAVGHTLIDAPLPTTVPFCNQVILNKGEPLGAKRLPSLLVVHCVGLLRPGTITAEVPVEF